MVFMDVLNTPIDRTDFSAEDSFLDAPHNTSTPITIQSTVAAHPQPPATSPCTPALTTSYRKLCFQCPERDCEECSICHSPLIFDNSLVDSDKKVHVLPRCKHKFHKGCIQKTVEFGHDNCPLCRTKLPPGYTPEATRRFRERNLSQRAAELDARRGESISLRMNQHQSIPERAQAARLAVLRSLSIDVFQHRNVMMYRSIASS